MFLDYFGSILLGQIQRIMQVFYKEQINATQQSQSCPCHCQCQSGTSSDSEVDDLHDDEDDKFAIFGAQYTDDEDDIDASSSSSSSNSNASSSSYTTVTTCTSATSAPDFESSTPTTAAAVQTGTRTIGNFGGSGSVSNTSSWGKRFRKTTAAAGEGRRNACPELYTCSFCSTRFGNKYAIKAHILFKHDLNQLISIGSPSSPNRAKNGPLVVPSASEPEPEPAAAARPPRPQPGPLPRAIQLRIQNWQRRRSNRKSAKLTKKSATTPVSPKWCCHHCGQIFATRRQLRQHVPTHAAAAAAVVRRSFTCEKCQVGFLTRIGLDVHSHSSKNCGAIAVTGSTRLRLRRNCRASSRLECHICSKRLTTQLNLEDHLRRHRGERPFECGVCGKSFSSARELPKHRKICLKLKKEMTDSGPDLNVSSSTRSRATILWV